MKKKVLVLILGLFLLTGCGNKVKCVLDQKQSGQKSTVEAEIKGKKIVKYTYTSEMTLSDTQAFNSICEAAKNVAKDNKMKVTCKKKKVTTIQTFKAGKNETKKDFVKAFKKSGYTCK